MGGQFIMGYAVRKVGVYGVRAVDGPDDCMENETYSEVFVTYEKTQGEILKEEITSLESQQTPRRLREAALSDDGRAWLQNIEDQIAAKRAELAGL